jgi:hypothetical protein
MRRLYLTTILTFIACLGVVSLAEDIGPDSVNAAAFDDQDNLILPGDIDEWVFLGSSLGMGYSQAEFDSDSPGMFQISRRRSRSVLSPTGC